jgi:hypothetical protein
MTTRVLVALSLLVLVGPSFAEPAESAPPPPPTQAPAAPPIIEKSTVLQQACDGAYCGASGTGEQFWATAEYLFTWFSGDRLPPLVTTSPGGTPQATAGIPGLPTTTTLFGGDVVNTDLRSGMRLGVGYWFQPERTCGIEAGMMLVESQSAIFQGNSTGTPILARPFFDASTNNLATVLIAFPGVSSGAISARASSGNFYEAHVDLTENVFDIGWARLDSLLGYRFFRYDEGVRIRQNITNSPQFVAGTQFLGSDDFATENTFHGGDFGLRTTFQRDDYSLTLLTKLAVGRVSRGIEISGGQLIEVPGVAPVTHIGNLLALPSNIGHFHTDDWTLLPELGVTFGWKATHNVWVTFGYSVLWLDRIARVGDQIDFTVNSTMLPQSTVTPTGPTRPTFTFFRNDVWLQSLSLGVEVTF